MIEDNCLPIILSDFQPKPKNGHVSLYHQAIQNILSRILPKDLFNINYDDPEQIEDLKEQYHSLLPLVVTLKEDDDVPGNMSFYVIYKHRPTAFRFFFELISRWLLPGKRVDVVMVYSADFHLPQIATEAYTVCEVTVRVHTQLELEEVLRNIPIIESEARLGVDSSYYARRILEVKGLSSDEKTAMIQEHIAALVRRLPKYFDLDILSEMQHVLVLCRDDFKVPRESRHLSRIISVGYLFRKATREAVKLTPEKRHLTLKIFRTQLRLTEGVKKVLGIIVGVNFLREKEAFERKHLLTAIQNYIPDVQAIDGSFLANKRGSENICTLYLEIEKTNGQEFSDEEIRILRRELPIDLRDRIEHLMHPVFMPRNEEEIMRNVLTLSNQIKYLRDIPQVFISFDEQTYANLFFTIILVRVVEPGSASVQELFKNENSFLGYVHDRCKMLGYLRKKYTKEATVFRVKLSKEQFLRRDHSIDLYKARQEVVSELSRILGEIRDYNGGMISKQHELLCLVRDLLGENIKYSDLLLENFFYSLTPVIMRTVLEPEALKTLFLMQIDAIESGFFNANSYAWKIRVDAGFVYAIIKAEDRSIKEEVSRMLNALNMDSSELANSYVKVYDIPYLGYIYRCRDPQKQQQFCQLIQNSIEAMDHRRIKPVKALTSNGNLP
jgi:hypothetical protein